MNLILCLAGMFFGIYIIGAIVAVFVLAIHTYIDYYRKRDSLEYDIQIRDIFENSYLAWYSWLGICLYILLTDIYEPLCNLINKIGNITIIHKKLN